MGPILSITGKNDNAAGCPNVELLPKDIEISAAVDAWFVGDVVEGTA